MVKKIFGVLSFILILGVASHKDASAVNVYIEPSVGVTIVDNATSKNWNIDNTLNQSYALAIGTNVCSNVAVEEETTYVKILNQSTVSETINAKVGVLPCVYVKGGVGVSAIPSTTSYGLEYKASVGTTIFKPLDFSLGLINAKNLGVNNALVASIGFKID